MIGVHLLGVFQLAYVRMYVCTVYSFAELKNFLPKRAYLELR